MVMMSNNNNRLVQTPQMPNANAPAAFVGVTMEDSNNGLAQTPHAVLFRCKALGVTVKIKTL